MLQVQDTASTSELSSQAVNRITAKSFCWLQKDLSLVMENALHKCEPGLLRI